MAVSMNFPLEAYDTYKNTSDISQGKCSRDGFFCVIHTSILAKIMMKILGSIRTCSKFCRQDSRVCKNRCRSPDSESGSSCKLYKQKEYTEI